MTTSWVAGVLQVPPEEITDLTHGLASIDACTPALEWVQTMKYKTLKEAWDACRQSAWMFWYLEMACVAHDEAVRRGDKINPINLAWHDGEDPWEKLSQAEDRASEARASVFRQAREQMLSDLKRDELANKASTDAVRVLVPVPPPLAFVATYFREEAC